MTVQSFGLLHSYRPPSTCSSDRRCDLQPTPPHTNTTAAATHTANQTACTMVFLDSYFLLLRSHLRRIVFSSASPPRGSLSRRQCCQISASQSLLQSEAVELGSCPTSSPLKLASQGCTNNAFALFHALHKWLHTVNCIFASQRCLTLHGR